MTNEEMLTNVRKDRPNQIINNVMDFKMNKYGFYDVYVDIQYEAIDIDWAQFPVIRHVKTRIPYPISEFNKLPKEKQLEYRWQSI